MAFIEYLNKCYSRSIMFVHGQLNAFSIFKTRYAGGSTKTIIKNDLSLAVVKFENSEMPCILFSTVL